MSVSTSRTVRVASALTAIVIAGAGCSSHPSSISTPTTPTNAAGNPSAPRITSASPAAQNKTVKIGDTFTVMSVYGHGERAKVTLLGMEINPEIPTYSPQPTSYPLGLHVLIDMTQAALPNTVADSFDIREELPGGLTATEPADSKLLGKVFADNRPKIREVLRGQKQEGWLLLEVDNPKGTLLWPLNPGTARIAYPK